MSPFRRMLAARGASHPAAYSILIVIAGMLVCMVTAVTISVQASNRAIDKALQVQHAQEARAQAEVARQKAEDRTASCAFIKTINDAYKKDPPDPPTDAYKAIAGAWAKLAERCE
jgi:hypothetical protein